MCYTGLCKYEITSGPDAGDCTLPFSAEFPDDAACMQAEREWEMEHPTNIIEEAYPTARPAPHPAPEPQAPEVGARRAQRGKR